MQNLENKVTAFQDTKLIIFKNMRDGALILDKHDRLLFIKAHDIEFGQDELKGKVLRRLSDPLMQHQFTVAAYAKPKLYLIDKIKNKWNKLTGKTKSA